VLRTTVDTLASSCSQANVIVLYAGRVLRTVATAFTLQPAEQPMWPITAVVMLTGCEAVRTYRYRPNMHGASFETDCERQHVGARRPDESTASTCTATAGLTNRHTTPSLNMRAHTCQPVVQGWRTACGLGSALERPDDDDAPAALAPDMVGRAIRRPSSLAHPQTGF
jgi:hypothetical protein